MLSDLLPENAGACHDNQVELYEWYFMLFFKTCCIENLTSADRLTGFIKHISCNVKGAGKRFINYYVLQEFVDKMQHTQATKLMKN